MRRAFTLLEFLIVIGIVAVLAAILFPTLTRARDTAHSTRCISNLHQIAIALQIWQEDAEQRNEVLTPFDLSKYMPTRQILYCQSNPYDGMQSYFMLYPLSPEALQYLQMQAPMTPVFEDVFHRPYGYWLVLYANGSIRHDNNPCRVIGREIPFDHVCE